jgi:hypothetical protein
MATSKIPTLGLKTGTVSTNLTVPGNGSSYTNLKTEMNFKCAEGHNIFLTWEKTRGKFICPVCKNNRYKNIENEIAPKKKNTQRVLALD